MSLSGHVEYKDFLLEPIRVIEVPDGKYDNTDGD